MKEEKNTGPLEYIFKMKQWIGVLSGFVYATGYLIVYVYLISYGINPVELEVLKIKYFHIGIIFVFFLFILLFPLLSFYIIRLRTEYDDIDNKSNLYITQLPTIILLMNLILVIFLQVMFSPFGNVRIISLAISKTFWISLLLFSTIMGIVIIRAANVYIASGYALRRLAWSICILITSFNIPLLFGSASHFSDMLIGGGFYFFMEITIISLFSYRLIKLFEKKYDSKIKYIYLNISICILCCLYFFSVFTFGLKIYPYIPVQRGGGDHTTTPNIIISFNPKVVDAIPQCLMNRFNKSPLSMPLKIIYENSSSYFLAIPDDAGGPSKWRKSTTIRPNIYEIKRENVATITYYAKY